MYSIYENIPGLLSTSVRRFHFEPDDYATRILCGIHKMRGMRSRRRHEYRRCSDDWFESLRSMTAGERVRERFQNRYMRKMEVWK